jgi:hypothetical protein
VPVGVVRESEPQVGTDDTGHVGDKEGVMTVEITNREFAVRSPSSPYITKSTLKCVRGWSERAIETLLGDCDKQAPNPHGRYAPPMRLYLVKRVEVAESSEEFRRFKDSKKRRGEIAMEAAERRKESLLEAIRGLEIEVPRIEDYRTRACRHYNNLWMDRGQYHKHASPSDNKEFLDRISVNYLRHEMSDYEERLLSVRGCVGCGEAREYIKERILTAISCTYPELRGECNKQMVAMLEEQWPHRPTERYGDGTIAS